MRFPKLFISAFAALILVTPYAGAQTHLPADAVEKIDMLVTETLTRTGVPSASIAIVKGGQVAYAKAYGDARVDPKTPATTAMRYSIGSISKQFTAAAILLLQEEGKVSLDDLVSKYVPNLTRANEVTIRQLLSHTSGYQDYWPQDYVMKGMLVPTTARQIMDGWARKPLDFAPGTKWQYSNTNFVIAGVIIEKVSGMSLMRFLQTRVFQPLGMTSVTSIDEGGLGENDPAGYMRYALGPLRVAPKEGKGWLFAAGELAMTAQDLAKWDISIIEKKLLKPASYRALGTDVHLQNGLATQYGLGISVNSQAGRRALSHGGEVSGFTAQNVVFPDDRAAIVVFVNQDAASAAGPIASGIAPIIFASSDPATPAKLEQAKKIFAGLQQGKIDRSLFTENANGYFSERALEDFASGLGPLGTPQSFTQTSQGLRGGMTLRVYSVRFANKTLRAWTYEMPDGKLEQYQIAVVN
ncbi:MAG TPA: serine hydrolase domain-containing protein [Pyrinomonadaceae bacterium]|nr:serine hydrolase domain-containing protein [Pyrinomonadaceae bacterium]